MKLLTIFLLIIATAFKTEFHPLTTTYYVSTTDGSDSYTAVQAQNSATPWKTLAHMNTTIGSGVKVLLKCGDVFPGAITMQVSNVVFDSYSTGAQPIVSGFSQPTAWTSLGGNVWETSSSIAGVDTTLDIVLLDGNLQRKGRLPNWDAPTGGWASYESANSGTPSITDAQLATVTGGQNYSGKTVILKQDHYRINSAVITSQVSTTFTYAIGKDSQGSNASLADKAGWGYFITDDIRTLDQNGEWFLNKSTGKLAMYFSDNTPTAHVVKVSTQQYGLNTSTRDFGNSNTVWYNSITANNIAFQGFNKNAVHAFNNTGVTLYNCEVSKSYNGFWEWNTANISIDHCNIHDCLNTGISALSTSVTDGVITNNTITDIALFEGMHGNQDAASSGIVQNGDNFLMQYNTIRRVGYHGIQFAGSNINILNNYIDSFCLAKDDGGGIYTWGDVSKTARVVQGNIVMNGIGDHRGRADTGSYLTHAYYSDGNSWNVRWLNNTAGGRMDGNSFLGNTTYGSIVDGNTFYKPVERAIALVRVPEASARNYMTNDTVTNNIMFGSVSGPNYGNFIYYQGQLHESNGSLTFAADVAGIGPINNNRYVVGSSMWNIYYSLTNATTNQLYNYTNTLGGAGQISDISWKSFSTKDASSVSFVKDSANVLYINPSTSGVPATFSGYSKKDVYGTVYNNTATIPAWSSLVLFDNGRTSPPPPAGPCSNCIYIDYYIK